MKILDKKVMYVIICLVVNMNKLNKLYIEKALLDYPYTIDVRESLTSTNLILKEEAKNGKEGYSVLIASQQTNGRGRMGRSFFSPYGSGLYMSVLLRPKNSQSALNITTDAAVAVAIALERITGEKTQIKWVNDIYLRGCKVCGILAEAAVADGYVVLGIGVNVTNPDGGFPKEIQMRAGSLFENNKENLREKIAVEILKELYRKRTYDEAFSEYEKRSMITGKEIDIIKNGTLERAVAVKINKDYSLSVKKEDGTEENIFSGDVSIRI